MNGEWTAPAWYWSRGLHDAAVTAVHESDLPVDWKAQVKRRNCLELIINARGALFETDIQRIRFYNYTVLQETSIACGSRTYGGSPTHSRRTPRATA